MLVIKKSGAVLSAIPGVTDSFRLEEKEEKEKQNELLSSKFLYSKNANIW